MDRRIIRTKIAIYEAFGSLLLKQDFEKITINDIANKANVNRSTIYAHFLDKYDLADKYIDYYISNIFGGDCSSAMDNIEAIMLQTFQLLEQNQQIFITLLNTRNIPALHTKLMEMALTQLSLLENENVEIISDNIPREIKNQYLASAFVGVIEWWITNSMPYSPEKMVDYFILIMNKGFYNIYQI